MVPLLSQPSLLPDNRIGDQNIAVRALNLDLLVLLSLLKNIRFDLNYSGTVAVTGEPFDEGFLLAIPHHRAPCYKAVGEFS